MSHPPKPTPPRDEDNVSTQQVTPDVDRPSDLTLTAANDSLPHAAPLDGTLVLPSEEGPATRQIPALLTTDGDVASTRVPATVAPVPLTVPPAPVFDQTLALPDQHATNAPKSFAGPPTADFAAEQGPSRPAASGIEVALARTTAAAAVDKAFQATNPPPPSAATTAPVFGYQFLGELGRGGMGVVYKARHRRLNRLVALKMILAGGRASAGDLERFAAEAEAVAQLHHRNIVQIYEIGEQDGQPFFALEFVDGGALDRKLNGQPQDARTAALIVRQLADAMQVAHANGIIHRDLKPANILLAGAPDAPLNQCVPKITDFGLARKFDDDSVRTRDGSVMGTPSYMSPEQAQGKIRELGPATDIYALGAVLYDLLTGKPPFRGASAIDTIRMVVEEEPRPPAQLRPELPRDLQIICLKCLAKEPARRYATAGELAEDLRRFLDREPILARPASTLERTWKWCRRRPTAAALIAVSATALLTIGVGGFWYAMREARLRSWAEHERGKAVLAREAEKEQRERAETNESKAVLAREAEKEQRERAETNEKKAVQARERERRERERAEANFVEARDAVRHLTDIGQRRLGHEPHMELVRRDILETAMRFHVRFLEINGDDPALRFQAGLSYDRVGEIEDLLEHQDEAEKSYNKAIAIFETLLNEEAGRRDVRQALASTCNNLGLLLQKRERPQAETVMDRAVALYAALYKEDATDRETRRGLTFVLNNRGNLRQTRSLIPEAEADYQHALELLLDLTKEYPLTAGAKPRKGAPTGEELTRLTYQQELARTYLSQGALWTGLQAVKADQAYDKAVRLLKTLTVRYPDLPHLQQELATTYLDRGTLRYLGGKGNEANADYQEASKILTKLSTQFRSVPDYRQLLANTYINHGQLLRDARQPREAERVWKLTLPLLTSLVEEFPKDWKYGQKLGRSYNEIGIALGTQNKRPESEQAFRDAIATLKPLTEAHPTEPTLWRDHGEAWMNLTELLAASGVSRTEDAEKAAAQNVLVQQKRNAVQKEDRRSWEDLADAWGLHAKLLPEDKKAEAARAWEQSALAQLACAVLVDNDAALTDDKRGPTRARHLRLAVDALKQAVALGYKDVAGLKTRPEFAPLRDDPEFRKLVEGLTAS